MPDLSTERTSLTPFELKDLNLYHQINTTPFVREYLWDDEVISKELCAEILTANEQLMRESRWGLWKIGLKHTGEVIGFVGFWNFFDEPQPQLLYGLLPGFSGQGYATETSKVMITYAFQELGFEYVLAAMDEPHKASQKVAQRLGMTYQETRQEGEKPTVFYRIDRPQ